MSETKKFVILPCSGIGKNVGTVGRWAAYELVQNVRPDDTRLLCLARLTIADEEAMDVLRTHPVVTIDGCPKSCASLNVERNACPVAKKYVMSKFLVKYKELKLGVDVTDPGAAALEMAQRIAQDIAEDIDQLKEEA